MPTVHESALKETDSNLELGLKTACRSPLPPARLRESLRDAPRALPALGPSTGSGWCHCCPEPGRLRAAGGGTRSGWEAPLSAPRTRHRQHAGTVEYIFHFSHFWSILSASLGFRHRHRQSSWERQRAAFSACYCH